MHEPGLTPDALRNRLERRFLELRALLLREGGQEFLRPVEHMLAILQERVDSKPEMLNKLNEVSSAYASFAQSGKPFADFFIWRSTAEERRVANASLDTLRNELWHLVSAVESGEYARTA